MTDTPQTFKACENGPDCSCARIELRRIVTFLRDERTLNYIYQMTNATTAANMRTVSEMIESPHEWDGLTDD